MTKTTTQCMKRWTTARGEHWCSVVTGPTRMHEGPCVEITQRWGAVEDGIWAAMKSNAHLIRPTGDVPAAPRRASRAGENNEMPNDVDEILDLINDSPTVYERIQAHPDTQTVAPLHVRITEGSKPGDFGVAENETLQFGALGWSGGLPHIDLYRANGERVRFNLEYFKKVAVAIDHIDFRPQRKQSVLADPEVAAAFVKAGRSEVERIREERDAFKRRLMESFVYMTLLADRLETTSISRADLAEEMRQFVRDGHKL